MFLSAGYPIKMPLLINVNYSRIGNTGNQVAGPPGVGKGTQCQKIAQHYDFVPISAGELLRVERETPQSYYGEQIDSYMKQGKIVPSEITCKLLINEMKKSERHNFLIDGFPRNQENYNEWQRVIGSSVQLLFIIFIHCPLEVCMQRCLHRGTSTGGVRFDDTLEILEKRIQTHLKETQPFVENYKETNWITIDGNKPEEAVFEEITKIFDDYNFVL